jgi:hypothetical protein
MLVFACHSETTSGNPPAAELDPTHALYEQAAGLLASAGLLRAAAHAPGTAAAVGPTLACLEASLDALAGVADRLCDEALQPPREIGAVAPAPGRVGSEVEQRFRQVITALEHARDACAYARVAVGPLQSCARHMR